MRTTNKRSGIGIASPDGVQEPELQRVHLLGDVGLQPEPLHQLPRLVPHDDVQQRVAEGRDDRLLCKGEYFAIIADISRRK